MFRAGRKLAALKQCGPYTLHIPQASLNLMVNRGAGSQTSTHLLLCPARKLRLPITWSQ
jgi:hypothetical protein